MQPLSAHVPSAAALLSNVRLGKTAAHNRILERLYCAAEVLLSPQKRSLLVPLAGKNSTPDNELSRFSAAEISPPLSRTQQAPALRLAIQGP